MITIKRHQTDETNVLTGSDEDKISVDTFCFCLFVRLSYKCICLQAVNLLDVLFIDLEVSERNSSI